MTVTGFLGQRGHVIPDSEYGWDTDARRGVGNYRIPKAMRTYPDDSVIPYDVLAKGHGM